MLIKLLGARHNQTCLKRKKRHGSRKTVFETKTKANIPPSMLEGDGGSEVGGGVVSGSSSLEMEETWGVDVVGLRTGVFALGLGDVPGGVGVGSLSDVVVVGGGGDDEVGGLIEEVVVALVVGVVELVDPVVVLEVVVLERVVGTLLPD